jgi:hypothetical protein
MATLRQLYNQYGIGTPVTWKTKESNVIATINSEIYLDSYNKPVIQILFTDKITKDTCKGSYGADVLCDFEYDYKNMLITPKNNKEFDATKNPNFPQAMMLADVMNIKPGDIFYLNYNHLKVSKEFIFSHYILDGDDSIIVCCIYDSFSKEYYIDKIHITDCGVVPYKGDNGYFFNATNYLTKERVYE